MGICMSSPYDDDDKENRKRSQTIDKWLEKDIKKLEREFKLLLLGSGESGKSTIVKQMKIIHQNGYSNEELAAWRITVHSNLLESAQSLVSAMSRFGFGFTQVENETNAKMILDFSSPADGLFALTTAVMEAIESVWQDPGARECFEKRAPDFYILDSAPYFFSEVGRIKQTNYAPNEQDVLRTRQKTTGINETRFSVGELNIYMIDVGGQRSERKKWIHHFEDVTSIIFCVALNEYDQVLLEETEQNRMLESLILFESVINSRWFVRTSIILFLNKIDLFRVKVAKVPLKKYFPDYGGGPDVNKATKYFLWRFMQANRAELNIYPHITNATDTSNIRRVFTAVKETVLQNTLKHSGIL